MNDNLQPVQFTVVCEAEDEFINDAIDRDGPADKLQGGVRRVVKDKVVSVEIRQRSATHATSKLKCTLERICFRFSEGVLTVGTWLTYGSCTIVLMVCSTDRSANS